MTETSNPGNAAPALFTARGSALRPARCFVVEVPELRIDAGAIVAVLGGSGVGKTTLLTALFGLAQDEAVQWSGERSMSGIEWPVAGSEAHRTFLRRDVCVLPQDALGAFDPLDRLGDQVGRASGVADAKAQATVLGELGIEDGAALLRRFPHQISGGQAQAMLLAVALLRRPRLLIADEPSTGLDPGRVAELVRRFEMLRENGMALLLTSHDRELVRELGAEVWVVREGRLEPEVGAPPEWPDRSAESAAAALPEQPEALVTATGVGLRLDGRWVLREVDLTLRAGESVGLVGVSGAGKTTLARILAGLLPGDHGSVHVHGPRATVQLLFQDAHASLTPHRTVRQLVGETSVKGFDLDAEAGALGLAPELFRRRPAELSGGERRRVALLRALAVRPRVLLLDEPTAELDRATAVEVVRTLLEAQRRAGLALVWITHDRSLARAVADRIVTLEDGVAKTEP